VTEELIRSTALVVPVLEAETAIGEWRVAHAKGGSRGLAAHVTLVTPWLQSSALTEDHLAELSACARKVGQFKFELAALDRFPQGVLFVTVTPREPFTQLIEAICHAFPEYPPYGGEFAPGDVIPHVTVAVASGFPSGLVEGDGSVFDQAAAAVRPALPIKCVAREIQLFEDTDRGWHVIHRVPLTYSR
jgi:hypothetical protein